MQSSPARGTAIVVGLKDAPAGTELLQSQHYNITVVKGLKPSELIVFADLSYVALVNLLKFAPRAGDKLSLKLVSYGDTAYFTNVDGGFISIPLEALEKLELREWLCTAFPHELTHNFLLEEFPDPPRWFIEGPASFFGNKIANQIGFFNAAAKDETRILEWAKLYESRKEQYIFNSVWPEDKWPTNDIFAGMGASYKICMELEALCGEEFFPNVFRYMRTALVSFSSAKSEVEKNWMLFNAMQTQTNFDIWAYFSERRLY